jgi:hypothetical protein
MVDIFVGPNPLEEMGQGIVAAVVVPLYAQIRV